MANKEWKINVTITTMNGRGSNFNADFIMTKPRIPTKRQARNYIKSNYIADGDVIKSIDSIVLLQ